jgi:endonuclease YncB( thermonuclease family)
MSKSSLVNAIKRLVLTLVFILTLSLPSWSQHTTWIGKVVGVSDGDTITVLHDGKAEKIRLYGIDCPEKKQAFGKRAKQFTSKMVFGRIVEARPITTDRYGRTIAWIYFDGACLNEELLKAGFAWHYKRYSPERHLAELETEARQKKAGLWSDPYSIPPWDFRHGKKTVTKPITSTDRQDVVYHGNIKSKKFHRPSCVHYNCKNCTAIFQSREEAIRAGYIPCGLCRP